MDYGHTRVTFKHNIPLMLVQMTVCSDRYSTYVKRIIVMYIYCAC